MLTHPVRHAFHPSQAGHTNRRRGGIASIAMKHGTDVSVHFGVRGPAPTQPPPVVCCAISVPTNYEYTYPESRPWRTHRQLPGQ